MIKDTQKEAVYAFELGVLCDDARYEVELSLDDMRELMDEIAGEFDFQDEVKITEGKGMKFPMAYRNVLNNTTYLHFPEHARVLGVFLHEAAHAVVYEVFGLNNVEPHGPEFVAIQFYLLSMYSDLDVAMYSRIAVEDFGIVISDEVWADPVEVAGYLD